MNSPHIVVAGAGHIGCFVGGLLAASGLRVSLLGRASLVATLQGRGLHLTDLDGLDCRVSRSEIAASSDPKILAQADIILVTVKGGATETIARDIGRFASPQAPVISLQNGVRNADLLRAHLPDHDVRAGMVFFNVVARVAGHYHRAIDGPIVIGDGAGQLDRLLDVAGLEVSASPMITNVQWGKLLLNLSNAPFALSGHTILQHLEDRLWRRLMADQLAEALAVFQAANITPQMSLPLPAWVFPHLLRLPTFLFRRIAASMMKVDPSARPSMWQDLQARRLTEVDELQGVIVTLAAQHGLSAPICARVTRLIHLAELAGRGSPGLSEAQIRG